MALTHGPVGYHLSSEELGPDLLLRHAVQAEEAGFDYLQVSDHYHPWSERQGSSPFVWGVLGAIAEATRSIPVGTAVTCPTIRIHPAIIAQAAATAAIQLEGRFFFGIGSGERLNETILGDRWPALSVRLEMMEEATELIRELWEGKIVTRHTKHYIVENARIHDLPEELPPIIVSAFGPKAAEVAGRIGDGLMADDGERVDQFRSAGGSGPVFGSILASVHPDRDEALRLARHWWPNAVIPGQAGQEMSMPEHFEPIGDAFPDERFEETFVLGDDPAAHEKQIRNLLDSGFDHVAVHQVGEDHDAFFQLYEEEVLPRFTD